MANITTVRLKPETQANLTALAQRLGVTRTAIIEMALRAFLQQQKEMHHESARLATDERSLG